MAVQFQNGASPFQKPKSFRERFQNLFTRTVSPVPEEEDKRGFLEKVGDLFFPPSLPIRVMFNKGEGQVKASETTGNRIPEPISTPEVKMPMATSTPTATPTVTPTPKFQPFPTPTLTPNAEQYSAPKWKSLVSRYFPDEEVNNALNVIFQESSANETLIHPNNDGSKDYGLMQINDIHAPEIKKKFGYTMEDMLDPEKNIEVGSYLWKRQGWQPWMGARGLGLTP